MDLKTYLWRHRISQNTFAKTSGITRQSISAYVNGDRKPRYQVAVKIQTATDGNVSIMELLSEDYSTDLQEDWIVKNSNEKFNGMNMQITL